MPSNLHPKGNTLFLSDLWNFLINSTSSTTKCLQSIFSTICFKENHLLMGKLFSIYILKWFNSWFLSTSIIHLFLHHWLGCQTGYLILLIHCSIPYFILRFVFVWFGTWLLIEDSCLKRVKEVEWDLGMFIWEEDYIILLKVCFTFCNFLLGSQLSHHLNMLFYKVSL